MFLTSHKTNIDLTSNFDKIKDYVEGPLSGMICETYGYPVTAKIAFAKEGKLTIKLSVNEIEDIQCHAIVDEMMDFFTTLEG